MIATTVSRSDDAIAMPRRRLLRAATATAGVGLIWALDVVTAARHWSVPMLGVLDEPAHLATAAVCLLALGPRDLVTRHRSFAVAALLSSMLIDLDHLLLYAHVHAFQQQGRPFPHSLLTVAVLGLAGVLVRGRARPIALGAAVGVTFHFVRDVATGPGLALLWPVSAHLHREPYSLYVTALVVLAAVAVARAALDR